MAATLFLPRQGRVISRIFPQKSVSGKPLETRMGKGKGEIDHWVAVVKPGTVLFEVGDVAEDVARQAFSRVAHKMPFRCRFVKRRHNV
jgi:large subunit ribosomal protein L16